MMPWAYYNDNDPYCCLWLSYLIDAGLLPTGYVDQRPIQEVKADDLQPYTQVHLFAGAGGWPFALQLAAWPDDRPIWTGSCPCPPFSVAGKTRKCPTCGGSPVPCPRRTGYFICRDCGHAWFADARHLWPEFWRLIAECRPPTVMGEQVSGADGKLWFAGVRSSLEILGYGVGAVDIPACAVGAPHRRNRIFWVAHADGERRQQDTRGASCHEAENGGAGRDGGQSGSDYITSGDGEVSGWLADRIGPRLEGRAGERSDDGAECEAAERGGGGGGRLEHAAFDGRGERRPEYVLGSGRNVATSASGATGGLGNTEKHRERAFERESSPRGGWQSAAGGSGLHGPWDDWELVGPDPQGKYRRVKPGIRLLADGVPCRVAKLRAFGNAIVPPLAAEVVRAFMETMDES